MYSNKILIINGPNLNLLGKREPDIYGNLNLEGINMLIQEEAKKLNLLVDFFQSNCEGDIVTKIGMADSQYSGVIINPAAYSHYSIAILDAIRCINIPVVEVHLTNIYKREEYRTKSVTAKGCVGVITGFKHYGYIMALNAIYETIRGENHV